MLLSARRWAGCRGMKKCACLTHMDGCMQQRCLENLGRGCWRRQGSSLGSVQASEDWVEERTQVSLSGGHSRWWAQPVPRPCGRGMVVDSRVKGFRGPGLRRGSYCLAWDWWDERVKLAPLNLIMCQVPVQAAGTFHLISTSGSQLRTIYIPHLPPGDIWQCLEIFLVITAESWGQLWASNM